MRKLQEISTSLVRLLSVIGAAAVLVVVLGWNTGAVLEGEGEPHDAKWSHSSGVQQAVLYGAVISPLGDQNIRGYAVILPTDDGETEIVVDVHGVESSVEHMQHIHSGMNCSDFGGVQQPLEPYPEADEEGAIHYREEFDTMPDSPGSRVVVIHGADGAPVACGAFEAFRE